MRWLGLLAAVVSLTGCAEVMPALSAGLDGAANVLKASCPERTPTCEKALDAYNASIAGYNMALLATAVGEDSSALEAEAMAQLKSLWLALQATVAK